MAASRHLKIVCSRKVIRSLTDIAVHICQIKRRSAGNFFLKNANNYFFVCGPIVIKELIICESNSTKNPLVVSDGYVKYEEAVHRSAIMQDF